MKLAIAMAGALLLFSACTAPPAGYHTPTSAERNTSEAERLSRAAADLIDENPVEAKRRLEEAIANDLWYGPAHNNLGVLYLKQGQLYEAAHEFEWARKLMPGHPDPRLNLGITLERAARHEDAIAAYGSALEVFSEHVPTMQALARLQVRVGREDPRTKHLLEEIALRGESESWRAWARNTLLQRNASR